MILFISSLILGFGVPGWPGICVPVTVILSETDVLASNSILRLITPFSTVETKQGIVKLSPILSFCKSRTALFTSLTILYEPFLAEFPKTKEAPSEPSTKIIAEPKSESRVISPPNSYVPFPSNCMPAKSSSE